MTGGTPSHTTRAGFWPGPGFATRDACRLLLKIARFNKRFKAQPVQMLRQPVQLQGALNLSHSRLLSPCTVRGEGGDTKSKGKGNLA